MASNEQNLKKDEIVDQLARRLGRLPKDDLEVLADAVAAGDVDFEKLTRDARRAAAAGDGRAFGFQRRLESAWRRSSRGGS
jgi:hypothetical protein